jgi:sulfate permease, SulP family
LCGKFFLIASLLRIEQAAIAMDMGEALDSNKELATVGIGNLLSGLTLGFTGSYIFSQTIFTYRTGVHSRWIGVFIILVFAYVIASPINMLEVVPLFFLGSTLVFIGYVFR